VRIAIIAVGKVKQPGLRAEIDEYLKRIRRYARCDEIELRDGPQADLVARFQKAMGERTRAVALEAGGEQWDSPRFARFLGQCENEGVGTLAWLVGGSYGLPKKVVEAGHLRLSLSPLTFPHRLVRLVLAEQVYRGFTILRGEPYSH
jgi:23S rRNA (pseudouridine1915-N3)-methyltransferase